MLCISTSLLRLRTFPAILKINESELKTLINPRFLFSLKSNAENKGSRKEAKPHLSAPWNVDVAAILRRRKRCLICYTFAHYCLLSSPFNDWSSSTFYTSFVPNNLLNTSLIAITPKTKENYFKSQIMKWIITNVWKSMHLFQAAQIAVKRLSSDDAGVGQGISFSSLRCLNISIVYEMVKLSILQTSLWG